MSQGTHSQAHTSGAVISLVSPREQDRVNKIKSALEENKELRGLYDRKARTPAASPDSDSRPKPAVAQPRTRRPTPEPSN
eukprot:m.41815 g.41815  ORF g.41815 m.41815 type:complete len:80 (+) comp5689_c1_seq2:1025-1264(+)